MKGSKIHFFQLDDARINLAKVAEVAQAPSAVNGEPDQLVMVLMKNGSVINIKGKEKVEAFLEAIDNFIEYDLS